MFQAEIFGFLKKCDVPRIRAWKSALDVVDAKLVESFGDEQLVGDRAANALALRAVTQRGVVDFDRVAHASRQDLRAARPLARELLKRSQPSRSCAR